MTNHPHQHKQTPAQSQSINYCNEPLKLNGSIPLAAKPAIWFDNELVTSVASTLAPTSPLSPSPQQVSSSSSPSSSSPQDAKHSHQFWMRSLASSQRQHQVIVAGTSTGALKRLVLLDAPDSAAAADSHLRAVEFDRLQVDPSEEPVLADLHLWPQRNPQIVTTTPTGASLPSRRKSPDQFALVGTAHKLAKIRINGCKAQQRSNATTSSLYDQCQTCAHTSDPFCGWCTTQSSCTTRDECIDASAKLSNSATGAHWAPFDQIQCADYQPVAPKFVPIQSSGDSQTSAVVDVNVRLAGLAAPHLSPGGPTGRGGHLAAQFGARLARAQFQCHFAYLPHTYTTLDSPRRFVAGATTKAMQARLNLHAAIVAIGCPLPALAQRPIGSTTEHQDHFRTKLSVRMMAGSGEHLSMVPISSQQVQQSRSSAAPSVLQSLEQALGLAGDTGSGLNNSASDEQQRDEPLEIERELVMYDCTIHRSCKSCLTAGSVGAQAGSAKQWSCSWCPMTKQCTFDAAHAEYGCAASALRPLVGSGAGSGAATTTTTAATITSKSLDIAQQSWLSVSLDQVSQCESGAPPDVSPSQRTASAASLPDEAMSAGSPSETLPSRSGYSSLGASGAAANPSPHHNQQQQEILVPSGSRRAIQVNLRRVLGNQIGAGKRAQTLKLECMLEFEGVRARLQARLATAGQSQQSKQATTASVDSDPSSQLQTVVCAETVFNYQSETAVLRAQLYVILNDNQVIDQADGEYKLYKLSADRDQTGDRAVVR